MSVELDDNLVNQVIAKVKTQDDLADLSRQLLKVAMERVLAVELEDHLGYSKHSPEGRNSATVETDTARKPSKVTLVSWKSKPPETAMVSLNLSSLPREPPELTSWISRSSPSTPEA